MKALYIHIGYHKTATTSIQTLLTANIDALRIQGINYAITGREGCSHASLANSLKPESRNRLETSQLWAALLNEISISSCPSTLISSECFLESKTTPGTLAPILDGKAHVRIICYLRPQLDWLESIYSEVVKDPYRRYTGDAFSLREVRLGWIDYHAVLKLWVDQFGRESIVLRNFESQSLRNGNVYDDFLKVLGIDDLPGIVLPEPQNVSLHPSLTEFLRRCNTIPMLNPMHMQLVAALQKMSSRNTLALPTFPKGARRLSQRQIQELLPLIERCNSELRQQFSDRTDNCTDFFANPPEVMRESLEDNVLLSADLEHDIFNQLPAEIQSHFVSVCAPVASRIVGRPFLPRPAMEAESRLRDVTIRQRIEARLLYSILQEGTAVVSNERTKTLQSLRKSFGRLLRLRRS